MTRSHSTIQLTRILARQRPSDGGDQTQQCVHYDWIFNMRPADKCSGRCHKQVFVNYAFVLTAIARRATVELWTEKGNVCLMLNTYSNINSAIFAQWFDLIRPFTHSLSFLDFFYLRCCYCSNLFSSGSLPIASSSLSIDHWL